MPTNKLLFSLFCFKWFGGASVNVQLNSLRVKEIFCSTVGHRYQPIPEGVFLRVVLSLFVMRKQLYTGFIKSHKKRIKIFFSKSFIFILKRVCYFYFHHGAQTPKYRSTDANQLSSGNPKQNLNCAPATNSFQNDNIYY